MFLLPLFIFRCRTHCSYHFPVSRCAQFEAGENFLIENTRSGAHMRLDLQLWPLMNNFAMCKHRLRWHSVRLCDICERYYLLPVFFTTVLLRIHNSLGIVRIFPRAFSQTTSVGSIIARDGVTPMTLVSYGQWRNLAFFLRNHCFASIRKSNKHMAPNLY